MKNLSELIEERIKKISLWQEEKKKENPSFYVPPEVKTREELVNHVYRRIPARYKDAETDDERFLVNGRGFYLHGGAGTGKTYILYALLKRARSGGRSAQLWNIPDKLAELRACYGEKGEGEGGIEEELKTKEILFLDDFGAEKQTEWNTEIMYRLINFRYEQMLGTFFASNLSIENLAERSGDRFASRIIEMCKIIKIDGEDKRLKYGQNT